MFDLFMLIGCWIIYGIVKAHEKAELARKLPPKPTKPYNLDRQLELIDWFRHIKKVMLGCRQVVRCSNLTIIFLTKRGI